MLTLPWKIGLVLGAVVLLALGVAGYTRYERDVGARDQRIADLVAKTAKDSVQHRADSLSLDSALTGWRLTVARVDTVRRTLLHTVHDTTRVPNDTTTTFIGMAQYGQGGDPATLQHELDSLEQAGGRVVRACTALQHDCAAVRAERDSLLHAIAAKPSLVMPTFWSHFHASVGVAAIVATDDKRLHAGPGVSFGWTF